MNLIKYDQNKVEEKLQLIFYINRTKLLFWFSYHLYTCPTITDRFLSDYLSMALTFYSLESVSYTHLDVYKRQSVLLKDFVLS